jgi:hypothetical protein
MVFQSGEDHFMKHLPCMPSISSSAW